MNKRRWFAGLLIGTALMTACGSAEPVTPSAGAPSSSTSEPAGDATTGGSGGSAGPANAGGNYNDQYNFSATTFDGETFELATYKGTPVVINFWESW